MDEWLDLGQIVEIPDSLEEGVYKCRVLYNNVIESIELHPYFPKNIQTLRLVEDNDIDYTFKYEDRRAFDRMLAQKEEADEILIVKNGFITDTSYSNIVFFDGQNWVTPDTYLLNGTQRQHLLAEGLIKEAGIRPSDLEKYTGAKLINAMLDFDATPLVKIV